MWYKSASFILDNRHLQHQNDTVTNSDGRPLSQASTDMAAQNPNSHISMYYQTRAAHHGAVTSDWLAQAQAAVGGNAEDSVSDSNVSSGEEENKGFSVVDEFNNWRKQPELAEAVAAIRALASVIRSSQATTMMELEIELKKASDSLKLGSTAIGLKTKEGVVLAVEKRITSPLLEPSSVEKIMEIDEHIGCAMSGLIADARTLVEHARVETQNHRFSYGEPMTVESTTQALCDLALRFGEGDEESMSRPFGVSLLIAGHDENGPSL